VTKPKVAAVPDEPARQRLEIVHEADVSGSFTVERNASYLWLAVTREVTLRQGDTLRVELPDAPPPVPDF